MRSRVLSAGIAAIFLVIAASAQAAHPRPKAAWPFQASLVPAYPQCTAQNRTHGPPLSFPSCSPPTQTSAQATVGTADAFGGPPNFNGFLIFEVIAGTPGPPDDTDVRVRWNIKDVRCVPTGARCGNANDSGPADYTGQLGFSFTMRATDHFNAVNPGGGIDPATLQDVTLNAGIFSCAQTASTTIGSTCASFTSYNAFFPGLAKDTKRVVQETYDVHIFDGGADGDASTPADNTVFLRPGIFVP